MNVMFSQSPIHVYEYARCFKTESNTALSTLFSRTSTNDLISLILNGFRWNECQVDIFSCADWQGLVAELGTAKPNTKCLEDATCYCCYLPKSEIRSKYLENPTEFIPIQTSIRDFPNACLPSLPLRKRRYCWMHGVNCLLSNTLRLLYSTFPPYSRKKQPFKDLIQQVYSGWSEEHYSLFPSSMKLFFQNHDKTKEVAALFHDLDDEIVCFRESHRTLPLTMSETVETLLDCIRVFKEVAYTQFPTLNDLKSLDIARNTFLKIYSLQKWNLEVTTHFMMNHAMEFLQDDLTAYHTLQESMEHHNEVIHQQGRNVFLSGTNVYLTGDRCVQLYQRLRVKRVLSFLSFGPHPHQIQQWQQEIGLSHAYVLPPKNLQEFQLSEWIRSFC